MSMWPPPEQPPRVTWTQQAPVPVGQPGVTSTSTTAVNVVRAVFSAAFGIVAIGCAALALLVLALLVALTGKDMMQILPVALSVPQAREAAAREMVNDLEEQQGPLTASVRAETIEALADGLADESVMRGIADAVASEAEARHFVRSTLAPALHRQAEGASPEAQQAIASIAQEAGSLTSEEPVWDEEEGSMQLGAGWWIVAIPVVVSLGVAVVLGGCSVLIARRRAATALALTAASFLTAAALLASPPVFEDWVPQWLQAIAGLGSGVTLVGGVVPMAILATLGVGVLVRLGWRWGRMLLTSELATD